MPLVDTGKPISPISERKPAKLSARFFNSGNGNLPYPLQTPRLWAASGEGPFGHKWGPSAYLHN